MSLKRTFNRNLRQFAVICGLAMFNRGVLPAPMCGWCRTPGQFNTYIATLGQTSQPEYSVIPTVLLNVLLQLL